MVYEQGANCNFSSTGLASNLQNGYVGLASKYNIYIIDEASLNANQKIVDGGPYNANGFIYISTATKN